MKINFRHGIISHQQGNFLQLNNNAVDIIANNAPLVFTIAHKNQNYTHSEDNSVSAAWVGPFVEQNYYLYLDFNPLTFERTFGYTTLEPVVQSVQPGHGNEEIVDVIPGVGGVGAFRVVGYFQLPTGKPLSVINSTANNGNYTVYNYSYDNISGLTTIYVNETVNSPIVDGYITLDKDSNGVPLYKEGRHWYDTDANVQYVLTNNTWVPVIRIFVAQLYNGTQFISMSINSTSGDFTGTQIGKTGDFRSGRVLYSETSHPIRKDDGTFFTTEDQFFVNQSKIEAVRLENGIIRAQCNVASLSKHAVVAWEGESKIRPATYEDTGDTVIGLLMEDLSYGQVGNVVLQGYIFNPDWDWSSGVHPANTGDKLWVDNGELVTVDPHINNPSAHPNKKVPVARVISRKEILFEQGLGGVGEQGPPGRIENLPPATTSDLGAVTLTTPSSDPNRALVISDTDPRLTDARLPLPHNHEASDIVSIPSTNITSNNVQDALVELGINKIERNGDTMNGPLTLYGLPINDYHAAPKIYVDNLVNGLTWLESIYSVNLISDNTNIPPSNPKHGDLYILNAAGTGAWLGMPQETLVAWDNDNQVWVEFGTLSDIGAALGTSLRLGVAMRTDTVPTGSFTGRKNDIAIYNGNILAGFETPVKNNATYVEAGAVMFEFDQFAFDGTRWIKIGGSVKNYRGDGTTIKEQAGVFSAIPTSDGGTIDAYSINGQSLADLDTRYSFVGHTHSASNITNVPFSGTNWGTPANTNIGNNNATDVQAAIDYLTDNKAPKAPLYQNVASLPDPTLVQGMLAVTIDEGVPYYSDGTQWMNLSIGTHTHNIPYDMTFYIHDPLLPNTILGAIVITRTIIVPAGGGDSMATTARPTTYGPTTIILEKDVLPYGSPVQVGYITFNPAQSVGVIVWDNDVTFQPGDKLIVSSDASPTDIEQIAITISGCSSANNC